MLTHGSQEFELFKKQIIHFLEIPNNYKCYLTVFIFKYVEHNPVVRLDLLLIYLCLPLRVLYGIVV